MREPVGLLPDAPMRIVAETVIAGGDDRHRYAPSLVQLPDGDLLIAYSEAIGEYPSDNSWVVLRRSSDGGRTWSAPQTIFAEPGWACLGTAGLRLFANGELICFLGRLQAVGAREEGRVFKGVHSAISRSPDGGRTWLPLGPDIWLFREINEFFGPGTPITLADGSELLTMCGMNDLAAGWLPALVQTRDAGRTLEDFRLHVDDPSKNFSDADLLRLADGRIMAILRDDRAARLGDLPDVLVRRWPHLDGTAPDRIHGLELLPRRSCGTRSWCIHRDMRPGELGVTCHYTRDMGATWLQRRPAPRRDAFRCGSPTVVRRPDGDLFCVYFTAVDHGRSDVVGVTFHEQ